MKATWIPEGAGWPGFGVGLTNADDLEGTVKRPASEVGQIQFRPINSGVGPGYPSPHILAKRGEAAIQEDVTTLTGNR